MVEHAVDVCFDVARKQANPFKYLYHNPTGIHTMQYFAHWVQRWSEHRAYLVLMEAARITGYEPVPYALTHRNAKRDGWQGRRIRCGKLVFYLIREEEMPPGLKRRYKKFREMLLKELEKDKKNWGAGSSQNTCG